MATTMTVHFSMGGLELEAEIFTWSAHRGARERGTGLQLEPDEPAGFEVENVKVVGNDDELTGDEIAEILSHDDLIEEAIERELDEMRRYLDVA